MSKPIIVHKGRTTVVQLSLGYDASNDTFTSQIRVDKDKDSDLIAAWAVSFATDGVDGELLLTLDDSVSEAIEKSVGYMDVKRVTGSEPVSVFDDPLEVHFKSPITV